METIMDGIVIVLTPVPIIDPFRALKSKSPLCHKDTAKFKNVPSIYWILSALSCAFLA